MLAGLEVAFEVGGGVPRLVGNLDRFVDGGSGCLWVKTEMG